MYSSDLYQKALNRLDRRREEDELRTAATLAEVSAKVPRLEEIQNQLRQVGFSISKAFFAKDAKAEIDKLQAESLRLQGEKERLLVAAGYAPDALAHHYQCPTCKDTGYVGDRMCTCQRELLKDLQREAIRRLAPLDSCTFDSFDTNYYPETAEDNGISPRAKADKIAEACHRYAQRVSLREPANLMLMGQTGLGKTHLLNAIGNYALVKDPGLKVRYVTSEEFTNEFIDALQNPNQSQGQIAEFNRRYRQVDVLLIDDIQFLGGKEATLDQFFHTFNALHQANKRIVIASDVAPKNLKGFEARLISRFESGLTVDVKPPDLETRIAILRMIASMNGSKIPSDVLDLIAERFTENIRELEGALTRVTAVASLSNQPVTRALAEQTLQDFFTTDVEIKPTDIISQVAKYFHLTFEDLVGKSRTKNVAVPRQIAMYLAREMTSMSLMDIGQVFGGRDHTTVMHACTRISDRMQQKTGDL